MKVQMHTFVHGPNDCVLFLASLLIGIMLRNVPYINVAMYIKPEWSFVLRQMSLGIILGEAGVEVDKQAS